MSLKWFYSFAVVLLAVALSGCNRGRQSITQAEFYRLSTGISYAQAQAVVGAPGRLQSNSNAFSTYVWNNADGSRAIVVFQNDRLYSKNWYNGRNTRRNRNRSWFRSSKRRRRH